jgi:nitrite reductase/ring-hydroxylating ferredoxin subunit
MSTFNTSLKKNDIQEDKLTRVDVNDKSLVLTNIQSKYYAMDSVYSHEGCSLEEGTLEGRELTCPWHQGIFDIRIAKASPRINWVTDLKSYC